MTDHARLRALCDAATPGPWTFDPEEYDGVLATRWEEPLAGGVGGYARPICHPGTDDEGNELACNDDFAFIAACDPATIRALLDAAEAGDEALLQATFRENKHIGELADKLRDALAERDALRAERDQLREVINAGDLRMMTLRAVAEQARGMQRGK